MPDQNPPPRGASETKLKPLRAELETDVRRLAQQLGQRHVARPESLRRAADELHQQLTAAGGRTVRRQAVSAANQTWHNLELEIPGAKTPDRIVVIGAHYDTVPGSPGADDNASGVAVVLALARRFARQPLAATLRFVLFVNEEPPWFQTDSMGSLAYARRCRRRNEHVAAMISVESVGYFTDRPGSQQYPPPLSMFYPSQGNFIGVVGNLGSRRLARRVVGLLRARGGLPCHGAALPAVLPGVSWSDHWSFWQAGYPAVMVTDTAPYRNPHYHTPGDTPDTLDFDRLARVADGLEAAAKGLGGSSGGQGN